MKAAVLVGRPTLYGECGVLRCVRKKCWIKLRHASRASTAPSSDDPGDPGRHRSCGLWGQIGVVLDQFLPVRVQWKLRGWLCVGQDRGSGEVSAEWSAVPASELLGLQKVRIHLRQDQRQIRVEEVVVAAAMLIVVVAPVVGAVPTPSTHEQVLRLENQNTYLYVTRIE